MNIYLIRHGKLYWDDNPRIIGKVVAASTPIERDFFI